MPSPSILGLDVTFPSGCRYVTGSGLRRSGVIDITGATLSLDACTSGSETKTISWKQWDQAGSKTKFIDANYRSFVERTAISGVSVTVDGSPTASVYTHVRGMVASSVSVADPLKTASVTLSYKRERYDLIEVDSDGTLHVVKGQESDYAASEFLPTATPGRYPLFFAYVWNDTVELVDAHSWSGTTPRNGLQAARLAKLRSYNQGQLTNLITALQSGSARIAGYGDSITSVGGGWVQTGGADDTTWLDNMPGNQTGFVTRESSNFLLYHDAALRAKYTDLGSVFPQSSSIEVNWGEGEILCTALASRYGATVTWRNWGIGGTNSGTGAAGSTPPNGGDATRLASFNSDTFDAVIIDFWMNDFVGFSSADLASKVTSIITSIRSSHPSASIIVRCGKGPNAENTQGGFTTTWAVRAEEMYRRAAVVNNCAFIPVQMVTLSDAGYLQISRQHYSGANRYNHQTPYELDKMASWTYAALGF